MNKLKDLDIIALMEDIPATHFETGEPITLYKGQVGTIVMDYDGQAFEVEFANNGGTTYAIETLLANQLMQLHYELLEAVA
jgi:ribosomal protein L21E